jgi:hypothetical protein
MVPSSFMISQITAAGSSPAMPPEIAAGFGVAGADEHAARLGHDGEDVAGLDDVGGPGVARHGGLHGAGAVGGRDAGGDAFGGFDRHREGCAELAAVVACHLVDAELAAALFGEREADQAAGVLGHEVDGFGRDVLGGDDDVAFVFAVFLVNQHDHFAGLDVGDDFLDRGQCAHAGLPSLRVASLRQACMRST